MALSERSRSRLPRQARYARATDRCTLAEAVVSADIFLGLSAGNVLKAEMGEPPNTPMCECLNRSRQLPGSIEIATALVIATATRSPGRRAAANSRIAGSTVTLVITPSGVLKVAMPVVAS